MRGSGAPLVTTAIVADSRFPFPQSLQKSGNSNREVHRLSRFRNHQTACSCLPAPTGLTAAPPTYLIDATAGHPPVKGNRLKWMIAAASLAVVVLAVSIWGVVRHVSPQQPSWCRTQTSYTAAEEVICKSRALWPLEAELNQAYNAAAARQINISELAKSQGSWLHEVRNSCGSDQTCLKGVYQSRIEALRQMQRP